MINAKIHARSLRYFDAICRHGSIRAAARQLHVDASAVNRQLIGLEELIGTPLFERLPSAIRLTEAGRLLAEHVVTVLQDEERLQSELAALAGIQRGELSLVGVESLNDDFIPGAVDEMTRRYPGVRIRTTNAASFAIPQMIASGEIDIGLAYALAPTRELHKHVSARFALGAVMSSTHPLAAHLTLEFQDCARYPLILASPGMSTHGLLAPVLTSSRTPPTILVETSSAGLMKKLAARGVGIAFLAPLGLDAELTADTLKYVPLNPSNPLVAELGIYVRAGRTLTPAIRAFLDIVAGRLIAAEQAMDSALALLTDLTQPEQRMCPHEES